MKLDSDQSSDMNSNANRIAPVFKKLRRFVARLVKWTLLLVMLYFLIALIGLIPVNSDFVPTENGIKIYIYSGEFHSDLILPVAAGNIDWRAVFPSDHFRSPTDWASHIAFGWGDREFYLNTPSWRDLKISTAANALLIPSTTVMHVSLMGEPLAHPKLRSTTISEDQFRELTLFVQSSFAERNNPNQGRIKANAYGQFDAFYRGAGHYHIFQTCNCWVGNALKKAKVKTGWFTPFPQTPALYLD
ncbi:MAG: TIGR02117 family protein [Planctomycetota bacterium]